MASERPQPHIDVMPHGPYEVSGDVPLRPKTEAYGRDGEPLSWKIGDRLDHPSTYYLCRCGQSENKPFCDGTHSFDMFDGTETASTDTAAERFEIHEGPGVTVLKDGERCIHSHFCNIEVTNWFEMIPDTDDPRVRVQLVGMIEHCPSGALSYELDGEPIEPDLPPQVSPIPNGPLFVSGGVPIERADGEPLEVCNRVTLCRCGQSSNKPLCDGTHAEIGFKA
jgi:CDGSH-type Zn-finger protein